MEQTILTQDQKFAFALIGNDMGIRDLFYLSGGTACAKQLRPDIFM